MTKKIILVTGAAGFIGFSLCKRLLEENYKIIGIDNLNEYYDLDLKNARLNILNQLSTKKKENWIFKKGNLENPEFIKDLFLDYSPAIIINLAAQAGVRYSLENPISYINSNILGFTNLLECCKDFGVDNFIYASSSSVYGGNKKIPFKEIDSVDHPVSLYAATKKSNELIAHSYSHIYNIKSTGLRFFTVYGPWGRPDMAPMIFTKAMLSGQPIKIFNNGEMKRDFTFIDDVIEIILRILNKPASSDINFHNNPPNPSTSWAAHKVFNIGCGQSIELMTFIEKLEKELGIKAKKIFQPLQPGDVPATCADNSKIESYINFRPNTTLDYGIAKFVNWYKSYYKKT